MNITTLGFKQPIDTEGYDVAIVNFNTTLLNSLLTNHQSQLDAGQQHKLTLSNGYALRDVADCNVETTTGIYAIVTGSANKPGDVGILQVHRKDVNSIFQFSYTTNGNQVHTRASSNGGAAWTAWVQLVTSVQLAAKLDTTLYTAADVLTKLKTVDGAGSGVDADLLDGIEAAGFSLVNHTHTLDGLSDVIITTPASGNIVRFNGTNWVNGSLADAGIAALGHGHSITDITGLQTAIDGKQPTITGAATTIAGSNLTPSKALVSDVNGKVAVAAVTAVELARLIGVTGDIQTQINSKQPTVTGGATSILSADLAASKALVSDASGKVGASATTAAELAFLAGVTSAIQTQINSKQPTLTGGATSIASANLGASKALVSDTNGKVAVAAVTAAELAFLIGVTSGIQAQINGKQPTVTGGATTIVDSNLAASKALVSDASGKVAVAAVTAVELAYLVGVTSGIQAQLNAKQPNITGGASTIASSDLTGSRALVSDGAGKVAVATVTATELATLVGITSSVQTQLNGKLGSSATAVDSSKVGGKVITVGTTAPASPAVGDVWIDTN